MAKSRLTPDYIEWVMSLNANQALREIHKVNEQTKEFERQQNAAREAMVKLVAEGKKGSKEWQNLKKSVKEYIKITSKEPSLFYPFFLIRDEGDGSATVVCPHCGKPVTVELK